MIRILKQDGTYSREQDFAELSFGNCTKITTQGSTWIWKENLLQRYCIVLVTNGSILFTVNKKHSVLLESDSILLIEPNTFVSAKEQAPSSTLWMIFFSCDDFVFFNIQKKHLFTQVANSITPLFHQLNSHIAHDHKPAYYYESLLLLILDEIKRSIVAEPRKHEIYDRVCQYISEHIREDLNVQKISEALNYNKDYLSRIVRECVNSNIQRLIIDEKLEISKNLLRMTNYSCEKIAVHIGIPTGNKFVKFFKYHTGESPTLYRIRNSTHL